MTEKDKNFAELLKVAAGFGVHGAGENSAPTKVAVGAKGHENSARFGAAAGADSRENRALTTDVGVDFERRGMLRVARSAVERSQRRARLSLAASFSGIAMMAAACFASFVIYFPPQVLLSFDVAGVVDTALQTVLAAIRTLI